MVPDNKAIFLKANAALRRGEVDQFLSFCDENLEWAIAGMAALRGRTEVRHWMTNTFRGLVELQVDDVIAEGQFVVALGHVVLQADDGTTSRVAFNDVWQFRDGRIVDLRAFAVPI